MFLKSQQNTLNSHRTQWTTESEKTGQTRKEAQPLVFFRIPEASQECDAPLCDKKYTDRHMWMKLKLYPNKPHFKLQLMQWIPLQEVGMQRTIERIKIKNAHELLFYCQDISPLRPTALLLEWNLHFFTGTLL